MLKFKIILMLVVYLIAERTIASALSNINIVNNTNQSIVILGFNKQPIYAFCLLHNPERVVMDIRQSAQVQGLPLNFRSKNMIKRIRTSTSVDKQSIRLVFELTHKSYAQAITRRIDGCYNIVLSVTKQQSDTGAPASRTHAIVSILSAAPSSRLIKTTVTKWATVGTVPVVVAIDAGHGGQDPGATGPNGLYEKDLTIAIALKLKKLLDGDKMFKPLLTRAGDYFISVIGRSNVAHKKGASVLLSIHADAAPNRSASGASVWVLSNQRANSEMANWLEQHEKHTELLGLTGDLLINRQTNLYLSQAVLDLQFGHSQLVGYDIAVKVLSQLQLVGALHKCRPEHASLGVLRSPDIPSLLVETGFISNTREALLLSSGVYQDKIANAIYLGLRAYFSGTSVANQPKLKSKLEGINSADVAGILAELG